MKQPAVEQIPVANPKAQYLAHAEAIQAAIGRVLESGRYVLGEEVSLFEREFADWLGAEHCVGVSSGTDAIALALRSCGVGPGDEVITVSHTAVATVAAVEQIGAVPVFADIDPVSRCISPAAIPKLVSPLTKAVIVVHVFGQPASMDEIMRVARQYGLAVVEDCAQAHGAAVGDRNVGTIGDVAAFSFYPTKNLGAIGDGGAVVTTNSGIAERCRWLREYGWKERYVSHMAGVNSRLDELQAAILRVKLPYVAADNAKRREIARCYNQALTGVVVTGPAEMPGTVHAMHLYVVETEHRHAFEAFLTERGICTARHYPVAVHRQPAYSGRIRGGDALPVTDRLYGKIVSLPMYPEMQGSHIDRICTALGDFVAHY